MNEIAKVFHADLDKSDGFIEFFSQDLEGDDWYAKPPGVPNPAIWTLGHLAYVRADFVWMLTGEKLYPPEWVPLFKIGSEPLEDTHQYPTPDLCWELLTKCKEKLEAFLETATEEDFASAPNGANPFFPTKAAVFVHLTHHEAHHTGNLALVRRMLGKEKVI